MWPRSGCAVPVAHAAFPKGSLAIRVREALGEIFTDGQFAEYFAVRGHPAISPARLAMVLVLQFAEGMTDRQAADAVRARVDWKYCLALELTDPGFDASVLSEFRARLAQGDRAGLLLTRLLDILREHGLLVKGGRQRTDATHVLACARMLNRLELTIEAMRAALEALSVAAPVWLAGHAPLTWWDRYAQRASDYRLPQGEGPRAALAVMVGTDGYELLEAVRAAGAPAWLREIPALQILRMVWVQQYYRDHDGPRLRGKGERPPGAVAITSPYDTDARYGVKRGMGWSGYKGHFTETCETSRPHVIVHVATTPATTSDVETVAARHADLAAADLLPEQEYVDAGYVSVDHILDARTHYGIELVGPLPPDSAWQARDPEAFDLTQFTINWETQRVTCPNGATSRNWKSTSNADGLPIVQATFKMPDCGPCPDRSRCTRSATGARGLTFRARPQLEAQRHIRAEQATDAWRTQYATRSGVEGTMAQASRRCDVHRARYRDQDKVHLQHVLTAIALNLVRVDAWLIGAPLGGSWTSRLTTLRQSLTLAM
ncbi:IS1182 family transposase [Kitasatospora sp. NPDC057015]|uniref:IS1182 family transposase n=1 Tax=Kitasatospora sp. NPDC057015 TaxID=3346001 RepID=UPI00362E9EF6